MRSQLLLLGSLLWREVWRGWVRRERLRVMKEGVIGIRAPDTVLGQGGFQSLLAVLGHGMAPPICARTLTCERGARVFVAMAQRYSAVAPALELETLCYTHAQQRLRFLQLLRCHTHLPPTSSASGGGGGGALLARAPRCVDNFLNPAHISRKRALGESLTAKTLGSHFRTQVQTQGFMHNHQVAQGVQGRGGDRGLTC